MGTQAHSSGTQVRKKNSNILLHNAKACETLKMQLGQAKDELVDKTAAIQTTKAWIENLQKLSTNKQTETQQGTCKNCKELKTTRAGKRWAGGQNSSNSN